MGYRLIACAIVGLVGGGVGAVGALLLPYLFAASGSRHDRAGFRERAQEAAQMESDAWLVGRVAIGFVLGAVVGVVWTWLYQRGHGRSRGSGGSHE